MTQDSGSVADEGSEPGSVDVHRSSRAWASQCMGLTSRTGIDYHLPVLGGCFRPSSQYSSVHRRAAQGEITLSATRTKPAILRSFFGREIGAIRHEGIRWYVCVPFPATSRT